ncbi:hypothetical protein BH11GEM1_BH11GEM1_25040 [soil metagenome]
MLGRQRTSAAHGLVALSTSIGQLRKRCLRTASAGGVSHDGNAKHGIRLGKPAARHQYFAETLGETRATSARRALRLGETAGVHERAYLSARVTWLLKCGHAHQEEWRQPHGLPPATRMAWLFMATSSSRRSSSRS